MSLSEGVSETRIWITGALYQIPFSVCISSSQHLVSKTLSTFSSITSYIWAHDYYAQLCEFFCQLQRFKKVVSGFSENTHGRINNQSHLIPVIDAWSDFSSFCVNYSCLHFCSLKLHFTVNKNMFYKPLPCIYFPTIHSKT